MFLQDLRWVSLYEQDLKSFASTWGLMLVFQQVNLVSICKQDKDNLK